jgi:hypothetical protein
MISHKLKKQTGAFRRALIGANDFIGLFNNRGGIAINKKCGA